jgi:uncharacterized protein (DUF1697 family)
MLARMPRCIAFLRAVNVGGRLVKMDALRAAFEALGLADVGTFIASGNVLFSTRARSLAALETKIEAHLHATFGHEIDTFIRTDAELAAVAAHAAHTAFDAATLAQAQTQVVGFLRAAPDAAAQRALMALQTDADRFVLHGRELYWASRLRQSESTFSNALFERTLKLRATFRGVNTVQRLVALGAGG